jgi:uroporphyrinogen-III decarboxylase
MNDHQWDALVSLINGNIPMSPPAGFIIDSPWLPGWFGISTLQYYSSEELWFKANLKAMKTFPDVMFLPGFWSEFGMCTEPSAFGAKTIWTQRALPHANHIISDISEADKIREPNPKTDGLLPFVLQRLVNYQPEIQKAGYNIKFAVARGPLNIASFLMGTTEFMMAIITDPEGTHRLLEKITGFTVNWLQLQKETFPSIEGILVLDDIVGFVGDDECRDFAVPYLKRIFSSFDSQVRFFHNDAQGLVSTPYLKEIGVNLFNFSFEHSLQEIRDLAGPDITLLGNLPPRDVMAAGNAARVFADTLDMYNSIADKRRILWSVGGGMPPDVPSENIHAFLEALKQCE